MILPSPWGQAVINCDVLIVGGGPAGAACAAICAEAGLDVLVVERAVFPRDKVCGDCLNPDCWPTLERLRIADAVRALPHTVLRAVEFQGLESAPFLVPLPISAQGEIAVKRSALDLVLLQNAAKRGAQVSQGIAVSGVQRSSSGFEVTVTAANRSMEDKSSSSSKISARLLVAADGRNSVVARLTGLLEERRGNASDRIGFQAHVPRPAGFGDLVQMRWFARGYGGLCPVGREELNVSLAGPPKSLVEMKRWARGEFGLAADHPWRTIAPLDRLPAPRAAAVFGPEAAVFLVGDAARVVEPFTGEGIYYALRTGELAATAIIEAVHGGASLAEAVSHYRKAHATAYRGRLWVNRLARAAGKHPRAASLALRAARWQPGLLKLLTRKVVG